MEVKAKQEKSISRDAIKNNSVSRNVKV